MIIVLDLTAQYVLVMVLQAVGYGLHGDQLEDIIRSVQYLHVCELDLRTTKRKQKQINYSQESV